MGKKIKIITGTTLAALTLGTACVFAQTAPKIQGELQNLRQQIQADLGEAKNERSQEREIKKQAALDKVKQATIKAINATIEKLNRIKARVANMTVISEEEKSSLYEKISGRIETLNAKIEEVNAATTVEEVKAVFAGGQKEIRNTVDIVKDIVASIHKTHLLNIITKLETLMATLEGQINQIPDAAKKATAQGYLDAAKAAIANAKVQITAGKLKEARDAIKEAHSNLVKLKNIEKNKKEREDSND
ncbi:MAG: hypothetical protein M1355_03910 [Patescibacteria group bacterium]|nr:hypothetical protein [Patescibacteria group bacterium]